MYRRATAEKSLQDQRNILPIGQLLVVFSGLAVSLVICFIDQNGLSVALPAISKELNAQDTISWAGTSSLIANAVCTVLYGRLSDIFGRKSVYISVLVLLSVADLLCSLAQSPSMLYFFRALAGIGSGGIFNMTMIIVSDVVTLEDRGMYQGILGSCVGIGNVIGPLVAAAFVQHASWRGIFYLLTPLAATSAVVAWFLLPSKMRLESMKSQVKKIDFAGVLTSTIAIVFILIPISGGGLYFQWDSALVISLLTIGGCSAVAFLFTQWKIASLPMMPLSLFKNPVITTLFLQSFLLGASYQSLLYYLPLYIQNGRGWSPIQSAICSLPLAFFQSTASVLSGLYMSRFNRYFEVICVGFSLWCLGIGLTQRWDGNTTKGEIYGMLALIGTGIGSIFQPIVVALQAHSPVAKRAVVISLRNFFRCTGGAAGLAISAAILQAVLRKNLPSEYQYLTHSTYALPDQSSIPAADWDSIENAYLKASHSVFTFQLPLVGVCVLTCVFIRDKGLKKPEDVKEEDAKEKEGVSQATTQVDYDMTEQEDDNQHDLENQLDNVEKEGRKNDKPEQASTEGQVHDNIREKRL